MRIVTTLSTTLLFSFDLVTYKYKLHLSGGNEASEMAFSTSLSFDLFIKVLRMLRAQSSRKETVIEV